MARGLRLDGGGVFIHGMGWGCEKKSGGQVPWPPHDAAEGVPGARDDDAWCKMHNPDPLLQMHVPQD